jgi:8-oxo-dGTP pyrophosphatase MutT (NUDIX family)
VVRSTDLYLEDELGFMPKSRIHDRQILGGGRWIQLENLAWVQRNGQIHHWEAVTRQGAGACVLVIATLKSNGSLILVRQYRPALDKICLEFPAGLVDEGESFETAALRELREETGYTGEILQVISPRAVSSGLTSESIAMVRMVVDDKSSENLNPQPQLEESEDLETLILPREAWATWLQPPQEVAVDAKLTAYLLAASEHYLSHTAHSP